MDMENKNLLMEIYILVSINKGGLMVKVDINGVLEAITKENLARDLDKVMENGPKKMEISIKGIFIKIVNMVQESKHSKQVKHL